jgi:DMSO/TMAO reductase YedYZ heme-binding membrane subunit
MTSAWQPGAVTFGVVALWGLIIVQLSSLAMKRLPKRVWRGIHLTSYVTFWLTSLHGTYAGTDARKPLYVWSSTVAIASVIFLVLYRILSRGQKRRVKSGRGDRVSPVPDESSVGA